MSIGGKETANVLKSYSDVGLDANKSEKLKQTKALIF